MSLQSVSSSQAAAALGMTARNVAAAHDSYMISHGLPPEMRLYAHSQGYDMVGRPLIRRDETMTLAAGMYFAVHPGYETDSIFAVTFATITLCSSQRPLSPISVPPQLFTRSPSRFAATVSLASVRPPTAMSSTERRMRVA